MCSHSGRVDRVLEAAFRLDEIAFRMARGQPALDVALGEIFLRLSVGSRLIDLGFGRCRVRFLHGHCGWPSGDAPPREEIANTAPNANEMLGLPPRTFFELAELAAGLRERPLLRQAVIAGEVSPVKAGIVMDRAIGEAEAGFVAAAMEMTVKQLRELVGKGESEPVVDFRTLSWLKTAGWRMTPDQQDRLDAALSLAREMIGYDAPRWKFTEAVAREWLAFIGHDGIAHDGVAHDGECEPGAQATDNKPAWLEELTGRGDQVGKQLRAVLEAVQVLEQEEDAGEENALGLLSQARDGVFR